MPELPLSEKIRTYSTSAPLHGSLILWSEQAAALEAENARLLGIEEQLQGIIRAQLVEINHHMDEVARLRKVYEAACDVLDDVDRGDLPGFKERENLANAIIDARLANDFRKAQECPTPRPT